MGDHISAVPKTVKAAVAGASEPGVRAKDKLAASIVLYDLGFQRLQGGLFILIPREEVKGDGDPIRVHEKAHAHNGIGFVILPLSIALEARLLFNLKVVVGAVVVKDLLVSGMDKVGVAV